METKHIAADRLANWVDSLIASTTVYGVQRKQDQFAFDALTAASDLRLDYDVTILPPKKYVLPPRETLMEFDFKGNFTSVQEVEPYVLFGIHPSDMIAILQLDRIFSRDEFDTHYDARRRAGIFVVSDPQCASKNSFAGCMDCATMEGREGYDVLLTVLDDGSAVVEPKSEKGEELMVALEGEVDAEALALEARAARWQRNRERLRQHQLNMTPAEIPGLLKSSFDHPLWEEKGALCYSCGACNLVCPTCYCFDIEDDVNWDLASGKRTRHWDGCLLTRFATVAGNHNFRKARSARYRHRYLRKGLYMHETLGELACVGCGRCVTACTANIANPVDVFNSLQERPS